MAGRPRLRDLVVCLAFLALGLVLYAADLTVIGGNSGSPFDMPRWLALITLAAACAVQSMRSTEPGLSFALCLVVVGVDVALAQSISVWLVLSDVAYAVALYAGRRTVHVMYATVGAITVLAVASVLAVDGSWRSVLLILLWLLALVISPIGYGRAIAEHRLAAQSERERSLAVAQLAARDRADAVADERRRLARDLHDIVAGHLSGIALQSAAALRAGPGSPITAEVLASVRSNSVEALGEMRTMIEVLGGVDAETGTDGEQEQSRRTASLRRLDRLVTTARTAGSPVTITGSAPPALPPSVDVCAYRIVAEALTNAARHAPAQPISVSLDATGTDLAVTVRNPLTGGDHPADTGRPSHGLVNMALRAESVGGRCSGGPQGDWWVVDASLPLRSDGTPVDHTPGVDAPGVSR
ncbi:sensor histidine kinase [Williamsia maris]|nr:histidine kinase [Williamsia maris]